MDNQSALSLTCYSSNPSCTKHIDICYHYIQEVVANGKVALFFIEGSKNPADLFTKNLGHIKFEKFREDLRLEFYLS